MTELSEERLKKDEIELYYYGFSSTQLYLNYRECIDNRLKLLIVEVAKFYEVIQPEELDATNDILLEQYKTFWAIAEPSLQKFYEDIQEILSLPDDVFPKDCQNLKNGFFDADVKMIEKDIKYLEEEYMTNKFYLESLKHCCELIENKCLTLQNKVMSTTKSLKEFSEKLEKFNILDSKRKELIETLNKSTRKKPAIIDVGLFAQDIIAEKNILDGYKEMTKNNTN